MSSGAARDVAADLRACYNAAVAAADPAQVVRAGLEEAARQVKADETAAANPAPTAVTVVRAPTSPTPATAAGGPGVSGITYTPPPGWSREEANWATIFRATLFDVNNDGSRDPRG